MSENTINIPERITIPHQVATLMYYLNEREYHCYIVGDCVKNLLIGEPIGDIDIIVNAELDRLELILEDYRIISIDQEKNEMVVMAGAIPVMIGSFRCVNQEIEIPFRTLTDELSMRDFTINAICADYEGNIVDPFDAVSCLTQTPFLLKAVGEGFSEIEDENGHLVSYPLSVEKNPVYLLKALALMGTGDYILSHITAQAIKQSANIVENLSPEELRLCFEEILMSKRVCDVFMEFPKVITAVFPELIPALDFDQKSIFQDYTLYEHLCKSVGYSYPDLALRYSLLFHGVGKPDCLAISKGGAASYYGHSERSMLLAGSAMRRLKAPKDLIEEVCFLIVHHDMGEILEEQDALELADRYSKQDVRKILLFASANLRGKSVNNEQKSAYLKKMSDLVSK